MRFNPFGHINTENFIHHSLGQRFEDAWEVVAGKNPIIYLIKILALTRAEDTAGLTKLKEEAQFSLSSYIFIIPGILLGVAAALSVIPGAIFLGIAFGVYDENAPGVAIPFGIIGALALLPVLVAAALVAAVVSAAQFLTAVALFIIASPFVLFTHLGCKIAECFSPAVEQQPLLVNDKTYSPSHVLVGGYLEHDASTFVIVKDDAKKVGSTPLPPAADETGKVVGLEKAREDQEDGDEHTSDDKRTFSLNTPNS